jgi:CubicO group peptidase (beta-lactamase class C family)
MVACIFLLVLLCAQGLAQDGTPQAAAFNPQRPVFPAKDWEQASPESQGVDPAGLQRAMDYLKAESGIGGATEALIVRNGRLIWKGPHSGAFHPVWSCTKSFTSTVLGLLVDDGKCTTDTLAAEYAPALANSYPAYSRIRLGHLASMTSGYDGRRGQIRPGTPWGEPSEYLTPAAPLFPAGTAFRYHDPAVHLLGYILTRIAGEPLKALFKRRVADPIGMTRWDWVDLGYVDNMVLSGPSGIYGLGVLITPLDLARFGHLFLNRGNWNGRQLISASWVDRATSTQVPASLPPSLGTGRYGFFWWTNGLGPDGRRPWPSAPPGTFVARGAGGNYCFVIPEWNMVVVRMSTAWGPVNVNAVWDMFFRKLAPAVNPPK